MKILERLRGKSWPKWVGYTLFYNLVFYGAVYLTFPYDALRDRITSEARRMGVELSIGKVRIAGISGVKLSDVRVLQEGEAAAGASAAEIARRGETGANEDAIHSDEKKKIAELSDDEKKKLAEIDAKLSDDERKKMAEMEEHHRAALEKAEGPEREALAMKFAEEREAMAQKRREARGGEKAKPRSDEAMKRAQARKEAEAEREKAPAAEAAAPIPAPAAGGIHIDSVTAKVDLIASILGKQAFSFNADAWGGRVKGKFTQGKEDRSFQLSATNLELGASPIQALAGLDLQGKLSSLTIDLASNGPDFSNADGKLVIKGSDLVLEGGEVQQFELPKVVLGTLDGTIDIKEGKADTDTFEIKGDDIDVKLAATVRLSPELSASTLTGKLQLKPSEDWWNRNEMLKAAAGFALPAGEDGWRSLNLYGQLRRPNFRP